MRTWIRVNQALLPAVMATLGAEQQETFKNLLRTRRVTLQDKYGDKGGNETVAEGHAVGGTDLAVGAADADLLANNDSSVVARKFYKAKRRVPQMN